MDSPLLYDASGHAIQRMAIPVSSLTQSFLRGDDLDAPTRRITRPMEQSAWVLSAVKLISGQISGLPLVFTSDKRGGDAMFTDAGLTAFWENPAKDRGGMMSRFDVIEATCGWLNLYGECFWVLDETWLTDRFSKTRAPFHFVRPDRMRHVVGDDGMIEGWAWSSPSGHIYPLINEQVVHIKNWNPYDDYRGLAPWKAAAVAANADYISGIFAQNLAANNGSTGEYIVTDGGFPTQDQQAQIVASLRAKRAAAMRGEFKPAFLPGGLKVESPQVKATDANFVAQRLANRHEIFIAFGIPASMADVTASYSIGSASDRFRLIEDTCIPLATKICEAIEAVTRIYFAGGKNLFAWLDWDDHSVMQQVRRERLEAVDKLWSKGVPLRECSQYLRLGLPEVDGWDVGYLPFSVAPVDQLGSMQETVQPVKTVATPEEKIKRAFEVRQIPDALTDALASTVERVSDSPGCACCEQTYEIDEAAIDEEETEIRSKDDLKSNEYFSRRAASIKAYESKFNRRLIEARVSLLGGIGKGFVREFTQDDWNKLRSKLQEIQAKFQTQIKADFAKLHRTDLDKGNAELMGEINATQSDLGGDPFKIPQDEVLSFLSERESFIEDATAELFEGIKSQINEGITLGESAQEISDRVRQEFNGISRGRANTIGRTETAAAFNTSRDSAMKRAKVKYKGWLASGIEGRMRPAHATANHQVVPSDQPFIVGGESLMFPGDTRGSAGNIINCMCVSIALRDEKWPY